MDEQGIEPWTTPRLFGRIMLREYYTTKPFARLFDESLTVDQDLSSSFTSLRVWFYTQDDVQDHTALELGCALILVLCLKFTFFSSILYFSMLIATSQPHQQHQ
jgi:hypothetical protein